VSKPGIDQLLIESALQPDLRRRLRESPDEVLRDFDLTEEEKDILRQPDERLLALLGAAITRQMESADGSREDPLLAPTPPTQFAARPLPDTWIALTVVPCAVYDQGHLKGITYAAWTNPLPEGGDPAALPPPAGAMLPGRPLAPLHAVIKLSALQTQDGEGNPQVALWATLRQASSVVTPPPSETAGNPLASPFGSQIDSPQVGAAAAAVRGATPDERYDRLVDLMRVLRRGGVR